MNILEGLFIIYLYYEGIFCMSGILFHKIYFCYYGYCSLYLINTTIMEGSVQLYTSTLNNDNIRSRIVK